MVLYTLAPETPNSVKCIRPFGPKPQNLVVPSPTFGWDLSWPHDALHTQIFKVHKTNKQFIIKNYPTQTRIHDTKWNIMNRYKF